MTTQRRHSISQVNPLANGFSRLLAFSLAVLLALGLAPGLPSAHAETTDIDAEPDALQLRITQTAEDYDKAVDDVEALEADLNETRAKLEELEQTLPDQQTKSNDAFKALYMMQQDSRTLVDLILGSATLEDFLMSIEYIDHIQQSSLREINRLSQLKENLEAIEQSLEAGKRQAEAERENAEKALRDAQAAREEAWKKALETQKAEEEEAAKIKAEEAEQKEAEKPTESTAPESGSGNGGESETGNPDWSADKQTFVASWGARIDAYLAGSPLAGQGKTFAEASWNYGVDPRWSPAIANTESTKGLYCSGSYNAWGWGGISWSSWEEAINAHVKGLANGYGYTITIESAKKYCPPNWEHWYNSTLAQMEMI